MGVPHLFVDNEQRYSTTEWYKLLSSSDREYDYCQLISLTWVKAMQSPVAHEFIQFIIEDTRNGSRTRVFSDRTNDPEPDRVIVGRDWGSANNPSGQKDLPLPLKSLVFTGTRVSVRRLGWYLSMITEREPVYHVLVVPLFSNKKPLSVEDYLGKVAEMLGDEETRKQYDEMLRIDDSEQLSLETLKNAIQYVEKKVPESRATDDLEQASSIFTTTILNESDKDKKKKGAFEVAWQKNMRKKKKIPDEDERQFMKMKKHYSGPGKEKRQDYDEAMECFVGGVLRLMSEKENGNVDKSGATP